MTEQYLDFLLFVFIAALSGFMSAQIAIALDFAMDYGHYFDWVRIYKVRKSAKLTEQLETFETEFEKRSKVQDFSDRINAMDQLYWQIAMRSKDLTLWLCHKCMSHRINALITIVFIASYSFLYEFNIALLGFYLISFSFNQIFINK